MTAFSALEGALKSLNSVQKNNSAPNSASAY